MTDFLWRLTIEEIAKKAANTNINTVGPFVWIETWFKDRTSWVLHHQNLDNKTERYLYYRDLLRGLFNDTNIEEIKILVVDGDIVILSHNDLTITTKIPPAPWIQIRELTQLIKQAIDITNYKIVSIFVIKTDWIIKISAKDHKWDTKLIEISYKQNFDLTQFEGNTYGW